MRKILAVSNAPRPHWVGDGFPVQSMLASLTHEAIDPFLMFDYAAPYQFDATTKRRGVGVHPHKGFETVTIVYQGELEHRDSTGAGGKIGPGDVQWMTAGNGILHEEYHSEDFAKAGGTFEVAQLWVNLPKKDKSAPAGYQNILNASIPEVALADNAGSIRVIAGHLGEATGPARTFTPMNIWDVRLNAGGKTDLVLPEGHALAVVVLGGTVEFNGEKIARSGETAIFARDGGAISVEANGDAKLLVLSGQPLGEPVAAHGPFVMNTFDEIRTAIGDFNAGKFGTM
jgi:redox-sensitive bicupin YhaK (pirin superfamily)